MIKGSEIRKADFPIEPLLLDRWSPRAMSGEEITEEELIRLFEAARWAPFPFNVRSGVHCMFVVAPSIGRSFSSYLWTVPPGWLLTFWESRLLQQAQFLSSGHRETHRGFPARSDARRIPSLDQFRRQRGRGADSMIWPGRRAHVQSRRYHLAARVSLLRPRLRAGSEYHLRQPDIRWPSLPRPAGRSLHREMVE